jgi:hypothetical protein
MAGKTSANDPSPVTDERKAHGRNSKLKVQSSRKIPTAKFQIPNSSTQASVGALTLEFGISFEL